MASFPNAETNTNPNHNWIGVPSLYLTVGHDDRESVYVTSITGITLWFICSRDDDGWLDNFRPNWHPQDVDWHH